MFFQGVLAALSPNSRYLTLDQNPATTSTDLASNSSELHQFIRKEGSKDESYGGADPLFWNHYFLMLVCAALAIALTAGGIGFHLGRQSTVSPYDIQVEAEGSKFYLCMSRPGRGQGLVSSANPRPLNRLIANKFWRKKQLTGVRSRQVFTPMIVSLKNPCRRKQTLHGYPSFHVSPLLNYIWQFGYIKRFGNWDINPHSGRRTHSASRISPKYFRDRHVSRASLLGTPSVPLRGPLYVATLTHGLLNQNNVRNGYYHLLLDPHNNETPQYSISRRNDERRPQQPDLDPGHIAHCFEYLRQTLICMADTNIEQIDADAGGVTGWGVERRCGDYDKVVQWVTTWKSKTVKPSDRHMKDNHDWVNIAFCADSIFSFLFSIVHL